MTKRSVEAAGSAATAFGSSEYRRLALDSSGSGGGARRITGSLAGGVPLLGATRTLVRFRATADPTALTPVSAAAAAPGIAAVAGVAIEGLELIKYYPPVSLEADPAPTLVLKWRLALTRAVPSSSA